MESVWSVSKLSTESVGSRRQLVANCVHTADATKLDSFVASASAGCIGLNILFCSMNGFMYVVGSFLYPHLNFSLHYRMVSYGMTYLAEWTGKPDSSAVVRCEAVLLLSWSDVTSLTTLDVIQLSPL